MGKLACSQQRSGQAMAVGITEAHDSMQQGNVKKRPLICHFGLLSIALKQLRILFAHGTTMAGEVLDCPETAQNCSGQANDRDRKKQSEKNYPILFHLPPKLQSSWSSYRHRVIIDLPLSKCLCSPFLFMVECQNPPYKLACSSAWVLCNFDCFCQTALLCRCCLFHNLRPTEKPFVWTKCHLIPHLRGCCLLPLSNDSSAVRGAVLDDGPDDLVFHRGEVYYH